ncbi:hypothetical protein NQZ68_018970 [Dissostichus eleginoides]|nr:hypothetical protein NQZ68_018970 [Dissostichus eleginoides]
MSPVVEERSEGELLRARSGSGGRRHLLFSITPQSLQPSQPLPHSVNHTHTYYSSKHTNPITVLSISGLRFIVCAALNPSNSPASVRMSRRRGSRSSLTANEASAPGHSDARSSYSSSP